MDREYLQKMKDALKGIFKVIRRPHILVPILIVVIIVALVAPYIVILDDASYKEDDMSNAPFAATKYTSDTTIDENGNITSSMTAHELWDELVKNESNITEYLDSPEELLKLMNAEVVTQYLDTRENPDEPIDWDEMDDIDSNVIHGIIKLKRADTDNNTSTLTYVDPETFQSYIDAYNESGSDADRDVALSHFTLEQSYTSSANSNAAEIQAGDTIQIPAGLGQYHTYMGWQLITSTTSTQYKLREQAGMNFDEEGFGIINGRYVIACTTTFGQVGDYIDFYQEDGTVIQCIIGDIKNQSDDGCNEWGHENGQVIVEFVVDYDTWYSGGEGSHVNPGNSSCHPEWNQPLTHAINGGSYFDNPNFTADNIEGNGNTVGGSGTLVWPTLDERITITSEFGYRDAPTDGASSDHKGIDIDTVTGDEVYATASGTVIYADAAGSAGNLVTIDHGDGYVTKYMHNDSISVSVGDKVSAGDVIAISGNTGVSTGDHLHFQIEYNGEPVDPLSFKYTNGMGNGTGGFGDGTGTSSQKSTYYAKVATWRTQRDAVDTTDPDRKGEEYDITTHSMSTTKINFQEYVSGYTMPFDYLWALLTISQRKEFVLDLADLVRDSEIEITIHDNLTITTTTTVDEYTNKMKTITSGVAADVTYTSTPPQQSNPNTGATPPATTHNATENADPYEEESEEVVEHHARVGERGEVIRRHQIGKPEAARADDKAREDQNDARHGGKPVQEHVKRRPAVDQLPGEAVVELCAAVDENEHGKENRHDNDGCKNQVADRFGCMQERKVARAHRIRVVGSGINRLVGKAEQLGDVVVDRVLGHRRPDVGVMHGSFSGLRCASGKRGERQGAEREKLFHFESFFSVFDAGGATMASTPVMWLERAMPTVKSESLALSSCAQARQKGCRASASRAERNFTAQCPRCSAQKRLNISTSAAAFSVSPASSLVAASAAAQYMNSIS